MQNRFTTTAEQIIFSHAGMRNFGNALFGLKRISLYINMHIIAY